MRRSALARFWAGEMLPWQRWGALLFLVVLALLLARLDLHTRLLYRVNLYPLLVIVAVILYREMGLLAIAGSLGLYHLVSLEHHWETRVMLVSNLEQLFLNSVVGMLCLLVIRFYRQRLEEEYRSTLARRDTVDYLIHELRNPLFAARGLLYAAGQSPETQAVRSLLDDIDELLAQLHDSHSDERSITPRLLEQDLRPLLEAQVERYREADSRHTFALTLPPQAAMVACDPQLVTRILDNLLGNAMKYAVAGTVELRVEKAGEGYRVSVEDQGPGVPPGERQRIFERHQRGQAGQNGPPGLGIGLYLSRRYALAQGGTLEVASLDPRGCFQLWLPSSRSLSE